MPATAAPVSRCQYLAIRTSTAATAIAGCSTAVDFLAGMVLEVADPDEEHEMVLFRLVKTDDAVVMTVIKGSSDLEEFDEFDDEF